MNNIKGKILAINISETKGVFKVDHGLVGDCVMPREVIFTKILKSKEIKAGDLIEVMEG